MKISEKLINKKLLVIIILVTFIFFILISKLFYIQIINQDFYVNKAYKQWLRDLPFIANRGLIKDRNNIILASSDTTYTLYSRPNEIEDPNKIAAQISSIIKLNEETLTNKLSKKGVSEVTIKKNLSKEQIVALIKLDIKGLYLSANAKRSYTYGNFLTQTLGFCNSDNVGQNGIELMYNSYLMGLNGMSQTQSDLVGRKLINSSSTYIPSSDGMTLNLTIDYNYQSFVEKAVNDAYLMHNAKSVSCIMMNANTGQILSIAQAPTYNLNNPPRNNIDILNKESKLSIVCDVYEPGSTFKIITSAIGLDNNKIKNSYYCPGFSVIDGQRIKCWRSIGHGTQDFKSGIANSCNCVFMDVALSCGKDVMYEGYKKYRLFEKTGIDFPGEGASIAIKNENAKNVDLARMRFGQAIAITPMQLISAVASIINGGNLYKPYIVESVYDEKLELFALKNNPSIKAKTISKENSLLMREYLVNVVNSGGGKNAKIEGYSIGGKTRTSQKYEDGKIARGKYISSFIGFTKILNEEVICLFLVDEPNSYAYYGSIVAAPFVKQIFQSIFEYNNILPENSEELEYKKMPNITNMRLQDAMAILKHEGIDFHYKGENGFVYYQIPSEGFMVSNNQIIYFEVG